VESFGRLLTAMVTPFDKELKVDYEKAAQMAEKLVKTGSDGIVVAGTTGESPTLSKEEKIRLFEVVVNAVGGKAVVIAGTGSYSTQDSIILTREAEEKGVDGVMLITPYYNKPPQEGLYQHFKAIAENTRVPVLLYNVPSRTGVNLLPHTVARLAEIENIKAIKEASGNLSQVAEIRRLTPSNFYVYSGDDNITLPVLSVGGHGVVSIASHLVGNKLKEMIDAFFGGNIKKATEIHLRLLPFFNALFTTTNPIPIKAAIRFTGLDVGGTRLPLVDMTEEEVRVLRTTIERLGIV
jgi:4-hydroxy-tetrahydrodipicolinate synthase